MYQLRQNKHVAPLGKLKCGVEVEDKAFDKHNTRTVLIHDFQT